VTDRLFEPPFTPPEPTAEELAQAAVEVKAQRERLLTFAALFDADPEHYTCVLTELTATTLNSDGVEPLALQHLWPTVAVTLEQLAGVGLCCVEYLDDGDEFGFSESSRAVSSSTRP